MGWADNNRRDAEAKANVQQMRDARDAQARADYRSSEQYEELQKIGANHAARKAAQSGSCMMARTTLTMLSLAVVVTRALAGPRAKDDTNCDGSEKPWQYKLQADRHPGGRTCNG